MMRFQLHGSMTETDQRPVANPLIVLREEFDDWAVLFDPDTGNAFGLNPTGVFIYKLLDGRHTEEEILEALKGEAEGVPAEASDHLQQFIAMLVQHGLAGYEVQ
jgi:SynChlorMet cassette protein ScmD